MLSLATSLDAREFQQVQIDRGIDGLTVLEAFDLMKSVMLETYPNMVIDWPARFELASDMSFLGCYGPLCVAEEENEAVIKSYTRENAPNFTIYINPFLIQPGYLTLILAHEMSHHIMTLNGYSIVLQHSLLCPLDRKYAERLGLPTENIHAACQ